MTVGWTDPNNMTWEESRITSAEKALEELYVAILNLDDILDAGIANTEYDKSSEMEELHHSLHTAYDHFKEYLDPVCVNAHDKCYEGASDSCPYCERKVGD